MNAPKFVLGLIATIGALAYALLRPRLAGFTMAKYTDDELGTVSAVPGLAAREKEEPGFVRAFLSVMKDTGADPDKMAALMSEETGVNPKAGYNGPDGPGTIATGLIGWMPKYAKAISGYDVHQLHDMSGIEQLDALRNTIKRAPGYLKDPPMQGWGSHIGESDDTVIATKGGDPKGFYEAQSNAQGMNAYDQTGKGYITVGDVRHKVYAQIAAAHGQRMNAKGEIV